MRTLLRRLLGRRAAHRLHTELTGRQRRATKHMPVAIETHAPMRSRQVKKAQWADAARSPLKKSLVPLPPINFSLI